MSFLYSSQSQGAVLRPRDQLPTVDDLRKIKKVKVEIAGDWPALRAAVNADLARIRAEVRRLHLHRHIRRQPLMGADIPCQSR